MTNEEFYVIKRIELRNELKRINRLPKSLKLQEQIMDIRLGLRALSALHKNGHLLSRWQ